MLAVGCGTHQFAGLSKPTARALAVADFHTFGPLVDVDGLAAVGTSSSGRVLGTIRSRTSRGDEAWLTIFRYSGGGDEACIWIWHVHGLPWKYGYEETKSVVSGYVNATHERCTAAVRAQHWLAGDEVGSEIRAPAVAYPEPVSPLGSVPRAAFLAYPEDTTAISQSDIPAKFPEGTAPGTAGLAAFVLDAQTLRVVRGAVVMAKPSSRLSAFRPAFDPRHAISAVSDRLGAVAFLDLPASRYGYDFYVRAPGYAPLLDVHDLEPTGLYLGDFLLSKSPAFEDEEPVPPPGSGR